MNGAVSGTSTTFTNASTGPVTISGALTSTNLTFASGNAGLTSVGTNSTTGTLTFASGNTGLLAMTGGTTLTVTGNCTSSVTRSGSGHVNGILKLTFPAGTPTCTYPIGDASNYTPDHGRAHRCDGGNDHRQRHGERAPQAVHLAAQQQQVRQPLLDTGRGAATRRLPPATARR